MESLNGQNSYTVTFAKDQTSSVHGFWSLTFITKGVLPPEVLGGPNYPLERPQLALLGADRALGPEPAGVLKREPLCGATALAPMLQWLAHGSA
jgi:hypothetical protein